MQTKISTTQAGLATIVVGYILVNWGFSQSCSNEIVANAGVLITAGFAAYKRYQVGDITVFGKRK